jgi:glycerophosphoryl diester phosphodiesterase
MSYPKLIGHRGLGDPWTRELGIAENSIESISYAAAHHADIVEGDVQVSGRSPSGSRTMYMMHDDLLDRTTNGSGGTNDRPWSYITERWLEIPRDLDGNGNYDNTKQRVPSFRSWLKVAALTGKRVFIEIKGDLWTEAQTQKFCNEVIAQGMASRVILAGGQTKLRYAKKYLSSASRSYSVNSRPSIATVKSVVGSAGYATISLAEAEKSPIYVKNLQAAGIKVLVYTLDGPSHYQRAQKFNFYGWFCDNTDNAYDWLVNTDA